MKVEDFYGKYILREGDLRPEEINAQSWKHYRLSLSLCQILMSKGLIFDNRDEAMLRYKCLMGAIKKPVNPIVNKSTIKPRIYISGPISGLNIEERRQAFKEVKLMLEAQGWTVFNPKENGLPEDSPTSRHMRRDLSVLTNEDIPFKAIYMMKGWNHSAGCWTEFQDALAIGLEVIFEQVGFQVIFE